MATVDEVLTYIATKNLGTEGTDLFGNNMPDDPPSVTSVFEEPGGKSDYLLGNIVSVERPRLRIVCRDADEGTGRAKAEAVQAALDAVVNQVLPAAGGTSGRYLTISSEQEPYLWARDLQRRWEFTFTVGIEKEPSV